MTDDKLQALYRRLTRDGVAPDADAVARLAAGEHLGEQHERVLGQLAASRAGSDALAVALEIAPESESLARALWRERGAGRTARPRALPLPWLAAAAAIAFGFTVMLKLTAPAVTQPAAPSAPVAAQPARADTISTVSFEEVAAVNDGFEAEAPSELLRDDFG